MPTPVDLQNVFTRAVEVQRIQESLQQYSSTQQQYFADHLQELQRRRLSQVRNAESAAEGVIYDQEKRQSPPGEPTQRKARRSRRESIPTSSQERHIIDIKL